MKHELNFIWRAKEIELACNNWQRLSTLEKWWEDPALAKRIAEIIRTHREIPQYGF